MYDLQLFYRRSAPRPPIYDLLPVVLMRTVILNYHAIHATPVAAWQRGVHNFHILFGELH